MTPARARLTLLAVMALFLLTAGNALFLQERQRGGLPGTMPSTAISITQFPNAPVDQGRPPLTSGAGGPERMQTALERELARRGYASQLQGGGKGLKLAVLAYEFDTGMTLTGEPREALLKQLLFDLNQAPKGYFADRAEASPRLVFPVQKMLLGLGFFGGVLSGRMDVYTISAVKEFQRHRKLDVTGRLSEETLLELILYSGQPLELSAN